MTSTEDRIRTLLQDHLDLGREADLDTSFGDSGVSSVDAVAFIKQVEREFDITILPEDIGEFQTLRGLVEYVDSRAG